MIVLGIIFALISISSLVISFLHFTHKILFNNHVLKEGENKDPYYIQSGIVFLFVFLIFGVISLEMLLELFFLFYVSIGLIVVTVIYTILSIVIINNKEEKEDNHEE